MNIHSGEILSFVSLPDFDLNERKQIKDKNYINRVSKDLMNWDLYLNLLLLRCTRYGIN